MTDPDVAEVVGRLSAVQLAYLMQEARDIGNPPVWVLCGDMARNQRRITTRRALTRLGSLEITRFGDKSLTDLGIRVRQYLNTPSGER
jgi:hypothetical protein